MFNIFNQGKHQEVPCVPVSDNESIDLLVVESDKRFLKKLTSMVHLAQRTYYQCSLRLTSVNSLQKATDHLKRHAYDIILTDISLSDASGFIVVKELIEYGKRTPVIVLSNTTNWPMVIQSGKMGISDFLLKKTLDVDVLMRSVFYAIEHRQLERKLHCIEQTYRSMVDILPVGLFRSDIQKRFTFVNTVFANMLDRTSESMIGKPIAEIMKGVNVPKLTQQLKRVMFENVPAEFELSLQNNANSNLAVLCTATPLFDLYGKVEGTQCIVYDATFHQQTHRTQT